MTGRIASNIHHRETIIPKPQSNTNMYLEMKFSDDSSVFSGLVDQENDMARMNMPPPPPPPPTELRTPKGILRASNIVKDYDESIPQPASSLTERSELSIMRDMRPMVDSECTSENSTYATASSNNRAMNSSTMGQQSLSVRFSDDTLSQESADLQYVNECKSSDSDSRIVDLLEDFERQMDANIQSLSEDNDEVNPLTDFNKNVERHHNNVTSQEHQLGEFLTPHEAKKIQRMLQKARKDVEILRDNNEQYKLEMEQMEEEHNSEIKLVEDRAKQKLLEVKNMYQNEIDGLMQEKDAAVIEAGRVAARYAENGKKQVSTMQKQVDRLKETAAITIKETVKKERETTILNKDKEMAQKLDALQKLHNIELEKFKKASDERLKEEVEKAVSSVAKRVRLNQDVLINELNTQINDFHQERHSLIEVLQSIKTKFNKHYPDQMIHFNEIYSMNFLESAEDCTAEKHLKEVLEAFSFLLESEEKKLVLAKEQSSVEEDINDSRKLLLLRHEAEINRLQKEKEEKNERLRKLAEDFKVLSEEKCLLHEKYQCMSESHKLELQRISSEKEAFMKIERSRKDLEDAMFEGQKELAHQKLLVEEGRSDASSSGYSRSIPTSNGVTDERTSIDGTHNHPRFLPRHSTHDSSRHPSRLPQDSPNRMKVNSRSVISVHDTSDCRSVTSNCSLSELRNQVREAEDQVFDIINTMSDHTSKTGTSADQSIRSKDTILSNFRHQSTKPEPNEYNCSVNESEIIQNNALSQQMEREKPIVLFKHYVEENGQDDDTVRSRRESLDESISSLQTNNGVRVANRGLFGPRGNKSTVFTRHCDDQNINDISENAPRRIDRGISTLGMFAGENKEKHHDNDKEQEESMTSEMISEVETNSRGTQVSFRRPIHNVCEKKIQTSMHRGGQSSQEHSTHLNFKKPPISVDNSAESKHLSGKKGHVEPDILDGKKIDLQSSITMTSSSDFESKNSIPTTIAVQSPANKHNTAVSNGHTLLCKPLSVQQSKILTQETISNLSGTFSSNDEDELLSNSHIRMRKLPPLTDSSDEESRECKKDKYQSVEPKTSHDNCTNVERSKDSIDDARKPTYSRLGLAAFRPSKYYESSLKSNTSDTISTADSGTSEATTAITGHTRKSVSFSSDHRRQKSIAPKQSIYSNKNGSRRFAALKARVRVRKV